MKFDPNERHRLDRVDRRKSNRIEEVDQLPSRAERGDTVYMQGNTYVYLSRGWVNLSGDLVERLEKLEKRLETNIV